MLLVLVVFFVVLLFLVVFAQGGAFFEDSGDVDVGFPGVGTLALALAGSDFHHFVQELSESLRGDNSFETTSFGERLDFALGDGTTLFVVSHDCDVVAEIALVLVMKDNLDLLSLTRRIGLHRLHRHRYDFIVVRPQKKIANGVVVDRLHLFSINFPAHVRGSCSVVGLVWFGFCQIYWRS